MKKANVYWLTGTIALLGVVSYFGYNYFKKPSQQKK